MFSDAHGLEGSVRFNHAQRHLRARFRIFRFGIPKPPYSLGEATLFHATRQWPPLTSFLPFHINPRHRLVRSPKVFAGRSRESIACTGTAARVDFTSAVRPPRFISLAPQIGSRLAAPSTTPWSWAAVGFRRPSGNPRYVHGKGFTAQCRPCTTQASCCALHLMRCAAHLARLVRNPEATPKSSTTAEQAATSLSVGLCGDPAHHYIL